MQNKKGNRPNIVQGKNDNKGPQAQRNQGRQQQGEKDVGARQENFQDDAARDQALRPTHKNTQR